MSSKFTSTFFSAPASALKPSFCLKPKIPPKIFIGKDRTLVLYKLTSSLKILREFLIPFSIPSNWPCNLVKFSVAFKVGYASTVASKRLKEPLNWPCAAWNSAIFSGVRLSALIFTLVALARAAITSVNVFCSKLAAPFTAVSYTHLTLPTNREV